TVTGEALLEVTGVGAVDHVIQRVADGGVVQLLDGNAEALAGGQVAVGFNGKSNQQEQVEVHGCAGNAQGLGAVVEGEGAHHFGGAGGECRQLVAVVGPRLLRAHGVVGDVAIAPGPDVAADEHRQFGAGAVLVANIPQ